MTTRMLEAGLQQVLAPNPSPMTLHGTNTYLIGQSEIAVIDPGPAIPAHLEAIMAAIPAGGRITHILVTHSHLDHSPLAALLSQRTGAPVLAAGPSDWGRSPLMQALADEGQLGGGEGVDHDFAPDTQIGEGSRIESSEWQIETRATPGHMANHLSFIWEGAVFSGDLVMDWSTSLVSPPDGDMTAFMASVAALQEMDPRIFYAGHGNPVIAPAARCAELLAHRRGREAQILQALTKGPANAQRLAKDIYTDLNPALLPAAERNTLAHLIDLVEKNTAKPDGPLTASAKFSI